MGNRWADGVLTENQEDWGACSSALYEDLMEEYVYRDPARRELDTQQVDA